MSGKWFYQIMAGKKIVNVWIALLLVLVLVFTGCGRQQEPADGEEQEETGLAGELASSGEYQLWEVVLGDYRDEMFRGVSFSDTREKVGITETFEVFEELPNQIGYTYDTKELETIDVYYHFSEEQLVNRIVVDIFLNGKTSADRLWQISEWYFTNTYGRVSESAEARRVWTSQGVTVVAENVSNGIDNGLKITFTPSEEEALAGGSLREITGEKRS